MSASLTSALSLLPPLAWLRNWRVARARALLRGGLPLAEAASNSIYMVAWWLIMIPGLILLLTTLSFNILGDALRDALDPASRPARLRRKGAGKS